VIHIILDGDDTVSGQVISLPEVPRKNEFIVVGENVYRVEAVTWYSQGWAAYPVKIHLEFHKVFRA